MSFPSVELQELARPGKGAIVSGPFGSNISAKFFVEDGVPVIRGNNLTMGEAKFVDEGFAFLTEEKAAEFGNCTAVHNDIIFTAAGSIGQVGIIPAETRFPCYIISNKQLRVRLDEAKVIPSFVYYWLSSPKMRRYIIGLNNGGAVPLLNLGIIRRLPIPMPPIGIQKAAVSRIEVYDDLIENNRRRIALLERAARLLYREWFVHLRFPGHEHIRISLGTPEGWERRELGSILTLKRGYDLPEMKRVAGPVPIVSSSGITGFHNQSKAVGPGVVTGRYGTLGEVYYIEGDYWPLNTALYVVDYKGHHPLMVFHLLKLLLKGIIAEKAAVPGLDRNVLHTMLVAWPPRKLQDDFVEIVREYQDQLRVLKEMNQKLAQARDLLLPRLMNGEIGV